MTPAEFRYARPGSLDDAAALLREHAASARVLAGGQSLIPLLAQRLLRPGLVIDINRIPELDRIEVHGDTLRMGALVRQEQARRSPQVRLEVPGLGEALDWVANPVVRERGTVVGNLIANASGSELPAVAVALSARFVVRDRSGEHEVAAAELLVAGRPVDAATLVTHVLWPRVGGCGAFYEVARRDGHAPVVGAMVAKNVACCRVGVCGLTAVGLDCPRVAAAIFGGWPQIPAADEIDRLLEADLRAPAVGNAFVAADYRRDVAPTVIRRAALLAARVRP